MKEILFKAKRKDNGEWVEGLPGYDINGNITELEVYKKFGDCRIYEIDPDTLCQYTGLTDKNGKKIWENDIVSRTDLHVVSEPSVGFIEYDSENTSFLIHWTDKVEYSQTYHWKDRLKAIGNILDNADLLEVE